MEKISNQKIAEVCRDASAALRKMAEKNAELQAELDARDLRDRTLKIAAEMRNKGISEDSVENISQDLIKKAKEGKLDAFESAVDMVGPNMGKAAQLRNDDQPISNGSDLERYVLGGLT